MPVDFAKHVADQNRKADKGTNPWVIALVWLMVIVALYALISLLGLAPPSWPKVIPSQFITAVDGLSADA